VIDFVGGYGTTLLGHNHPELIKLMTDTLHNGSPINSQGSIRRCAGQLAQELSKRLKAHSGCEYITTLLTTGAEAVEAAVRHALFEYQSWVKLAEAEFYRKFALLANRLGWATPLSSQFVEDIFE
jgi:acetylornithine/succinyldiaminopimelate/putrescine aminotransferase